MAEEYSLAGKVARKLLDDHGVTAVVTSENGVIRVATPDGKHAIGISGVVTKAKIAGVAQMLKSLP